MEGSSTMEDLSFTSSHTEEKLVEDYPDVGARVLQCQKLFVAHADGDFGRTSKSQSHDPPWRELKGARLLVPPSGIPRG